MLLNVKKAADRLGISPATLYLLVAARRISHLRIGVGRGGIRFTDDQLAAYLQSCRVEPALAPVCPHRLKHLSVRSR